MKSLRFSTGIAAFAVLSLLVAAPKAEAQTYTDTFPSAGSSVVGSVGHFGGKVGYFWSASRGDKVSEVFAGTGLFSVTGLDLDFSIMDNVLNSGAHVDWDVRVNGTSVGTWSWADGMGTGPVHLSYSFAPIVGAGTYDVGMFVTNNVASGHGSISIGEGGRMTLHGASATTPEPATMALLASGVLPLIGRLRRRKQTEDVETA